MGNMAHCRFYNTAQDLKDCLDHIDDDLSDEEAEARKRLVKLCRKFIDAYDEDADQ